MSSVASTPARTSGADVASVVICSLIWGTTWFAITLQFGDVPTTASVVYRFALASGLLFAFCLISRRSLRFSRAQHLAVFGQGVFTFSFQYALVYAAEQTVPSAIVAVVFAGLAFANLLVFRLTLGQNAPRSTWIGASLGVLGVAVLSVSELARARMDEAVVRGIGLAVLAVALSAVGNLFAHRSQKLGADVLPGTAWSMAYGSGMLALYGLVTGLDWKFDFGVRYVGSLLYLALFGSVAAFLLYFNLARRRGYTLASYIGALTPPTAMLVSTALEGARFGVPAFFGLAIVLAGQALIIRGARS